ncbi:TetR/AcrR family transcriptional regulator [Longispora albida]|uniref:TetR/AcrR family transcriptional regulator n=1 Tax=Longispora albida TaxID=203523 RepID=UPI0003648F7F|nr:TetR/AcrR family transcriptional regulator [Longispora albida]
MAPRSEAVNQRLREQSRERLLGAALEVFAERGYQQATVAEITGRAGVARGLLSYYFASKKSVLEELLTRWLTGLFHLFTAAMEGGTADERLSGLIVGVLDAAGTTVPVQRLMLTLMLQPGTREVFAEVEARHLTAVTGMEDRVRALFAERGAADPALEEIMLRSVLEGVVYKLAVYPDTYPLAAAKARILQFYGLPPGAQRDGPATPRLRATS